MSEDFSNFGECGGKKKSSRRIPRESAERKLEHSPRGTTLPSERVF
jgi:hypothetical protein